jgi:uncharacterized protein YqjF (DUF2071 family)
MNTLFLADWLNVVFMHFRADSKALQQIVPLELDRFDGDAYISLVAFTQSRLRFSRGGRWMELFTAPLAQHEFLNVRTYVRHGDVRGIYFLAEWIPNRLAVLIGPRMYGLPYRLGRLRYQNDWRLKEMRGEVKAAGRSLVYSARPRCTEFQKATSGSLDAFLLERYTAFTHRDGVIRRFDVAHAPWPIVPVDAKVNLDARICAAHFAPGVHDVAISPPRRVTLADTYLRLMARVVDLSPAPILIV